jgi:Protein of unknown function (DUF1761)
MSSAAPAPSVQGPRINFVAIIASALVFYAIQAMWFSVFKVPWLNGLGKSIPELMAELSGRPTWPLYAGALICNFIIAFVMDRIFVRVGVRGAFAGIGWAAILWFGFVATVITTNYSFELRSATLLALDAGCPLLGMLATGAILGTWRLKPRGGVPVASQAR